jgi:SAM-dependent methyltransferase
MTNIVKSTDLETIRVHYEKRFHKFGYSPKTLDWDKGKQSLRFHILTSQLNLTGKRILDIGCGFGDLNQTLKAATENNYSYVGIDICPPLIEEACRRYANDRVTFKCNDIQTVNLDDIDFAIASGIFNTKFKRSDNRAFIRDTMHKTFEIVNIGFAFDFLSDKVDFRKENTYHSSPSDILDMAYSLSRNVILLNNYMPFEFSLFVFKDDGYDSSTTIFDRWIEQNKTENHSI